MDSSQLIRRLSVGRSGAFAPPTAVIVDDTIIMKTPDSLFPKGGIGGGAPGTAPCEVTLTCDTIESICSKQGWYVDDPDSGYGDPVKVYKHAEVSIIRGDEAGGCPRGEFCIRIEASWTADVAVDVPDYCFGAFGANPVSVVSGGGGVQSPSGVVFQATAAQVTLSDIAGSFVNHSPGDPDITCAIELVAYHGSGHLAGIDWYPTSTPPANCCCNSASVDAAYYHNYTFSGSTIEQTKTDDTISYVEYVVGAQKFEYYVLLDAEDTDGDVMSRAIACLPEYSGDYALSDPYCVAALFVSDLGVTVQRMKPKFSIPSALASDLEVVYNEHFVSEDLTEETWTPRTVTIPAGDTFVVGPEVMEPSENGHIDITDIDC